MMNLGKELLFFFSALGAFNGLILSVYFFFFTRKKYLANHLLGALLLALCIRITKSIFLYFHGSLPRIYLQIGLSACFFIGPFLYYFVRSAVKGVHVLPNSWKWGMALLLMIIVGVGVLFPYESHPGLWNNYFAQIIYVQWCAYIIVTGFVLNGILKNMFIKAYRLKAAEVWLLMIFFGNALIFVTYLLAWVAPFAPYISGAIVFSLILYLIISILLYRKKTDDLFVLSPNKYSGKKVNEEDAGILLRKLEVIMSEKEPYKNPDLTLNDLSRLINVSSHQLSQLLNDNLGKNFTTFVNEFRINEACKIISTNDHLTLEAVGYEVGFNAKSTFFAAFKKLTGTTPSHYQQNTLKV